MENFILIFFIFISLISLAYGICLLDKTKKFVKTAIKTKATAIDSVLSKSKSGVCFKVSYEFEDKNGEKITSQFNSNKNIKSGSQIDVLYSKNDPNYHKVNNFSSLYLMPTLFIINAPLILVAAFSSI